MRFAIQDKHRMGFVYRYKMHRGLVCSGYRVTYHKMKKRTYKTYEEAWDRRRKLGLSEVCNIVEVKEEYPPKKIPKGLRWGDATE